jgi:tartrate dehydrogenase/decarboxylase/D-malate dehydrogenase
MMLDFLGEKEASNSIINSIEKTLSNKKNRTKDLNGDSNTVECAKAVIDNLS